MAYIDSVYYREKFEGEPIPDEELKRLIDIASEIVQNLCTVTLYPEDLESDDFKRAVAFQVEMLFDQGGVSAVMGHSDVALSGGSESLGGYSVSAGSSAQSSLKTMESIPISPMTSMILKRKGLISSWAYADYYRRLQHGES